jgi:hypothetical protein
MCNKFIETFTSFENSTEEKILFWIKSHKYRWGVCCSPIIRAVSRRYTSQSGSIICWSLVNGILQYQNKDLSFLNIKSHFCVTHVWSINKARRRFRWLFSPIRFAKSTGNWIPSIVATFFKIPLIYFKYSRWKYHAFYSKQTSSIVGAATRIAKHRLRIAGITRDVELQQRISRHEPTYFSIVRRRPCWASRVNLSTSTITITRHKYDTFSW